MNRKHKIKEGSSTSIYDNESYVARHYPVLLTVSQNMDDSIAYYDLRQLQHELEHFLLFLMKKYKTLSTKLSNPDQPMDNKVEKSKNNHDEHVDSKNQMVVEGFERRKGISIVEKSSTNFEGAVMPSNVGESKLSLTDDKPFKKIKVTAEKVHKSSVSSRAKSKKMQQSSKSQEYGFPEKSEVPKVQKNDSPNRFWAFVESYCSDITMDDIKMLEKWIESHENDSEYQSIPELGAHYTSKWIENDLLEELREGSKSMENPAGRDCSSLENVHVSDMTDRVQDKVNVLDSEHPSLVEKLISSLVHENIITSPNDVMTESVSDNNLSTRKDSESSHFPQMNEDTLESRLRAHLVELGILENAPKEESDDELLLELKRLQASLIPVSQYNLQKKQKLLVRAKAEMARQEAQKRIQEADAKVMESYRTMYAARSKGKKISKKELNQIKEMLEERKTVIKNSRIAY